MYNTLCMYISRYFICKDCNHHNSQLYLLINNHDCDRWSKMMMMMMMVDRSICYSRSWHKGGHMEVT